MTKEPEGTTKMIDDNANKVVLSSQEIRHLAKSDSVSFLVLSDENDDKAYVDLLDRKSVDEITSILRNVVQRPDISKARRRRIVAQIIKNQPHSTGHFKKFDGWNQDLRNMGCSRDRAVGVTGMLSSPVISIAFFYASQDASGGEHFMASLIVALVFAVGMFLPSLGIISNARKSSEEVYPDRRKISAHEYMRDAVFQLVQLESEKRSAEKAHEDKTIGELRQTDKSIQEFLRRHSGEDAARMSASLRQKREEREALESANDPDRATPAPKPVISSRSRVLSDYNEAIARIGSYETDVAKAISYPSFNDITVPAVSAMVLQMCKCRRLVEEMTSDTVGTVADAVDELWVAVQTAEKVCRQMKWSDFEEDERKDLKTAKALLAHAEDTANSKEARFGFYEQLNRVVHRLNERRENMVPTKTVQLLGERTRLELLPAEALE